EEALAISCELSDHWGEATATLNLGQVSLATGDFIAAIDRFAAALTGFRALGQQAGIAAALSSLAHAYALLGDRAAALSYAAESLRVSQAAGLLRIEGYAQHNRGLALLDWSGKTSSHEAAESLRAACYIRERLGERENLAESRACLALILAAGHPMEAQQAAAAAATDLAESADRAGLRQLIAYAAAVAARAADDMPAAKAHLRVAAEVMRAAAAALPESERQRFLQQVPLNRATQAALDTLSHQINVRIVRADVPLGRSLTSDDYRSIRWTVASPDDATIAHAADRRRYIIHRLISEATAQGVAPTDTDLAQALGVSRRTILRDIEHLALTGVNILTRRRR
ncbi:MAG: tetratricopeptide repeat protein, partial [Oscillochloris sp.]|nr:tetratricopeptide repeat protein [Oscillochloris sp.]